MANDRRLLDRRDFMKFTAMAAGGVALGGSLSSVNAEKAAEETESPIYVALNTSKIVNNEESFRTMKKVGPRVCITTATHPGFVGFQANIQTGFFPWPGATAAGVWT